MTYLIPKASQVFQGPTIDCKTIGIYTIFQPTSTFIITGITFTAVDVTGGVSGFSSNLGTNSPDFDNYVAGIGSSVTANGKYQFFIFYESLLHRGIIYFQRRSRYNSV